MPTATVQRQARALAAATVCATLAASEPSLGAEFSAGGFSFSDELGGFRLLSASGSGRPDDPIVLAEEIFNVQPVTLVIRNLSLVAGRPLQTQFVACEEGRQRFQPRLGGVRARAAGDPQEAERL